MIYLLLSSSVIASPCAVGDYLRQRRKFFCFVGLWGGRSLPVTSVGTISFGEGALVDHVATLLRLLTESLTNPSFK